MFHSDEIILHTDLSSCPDHDETMMLMTTEELSLPASDVDWQVEADEKTTSKLFASHDADTDSPPYANVEMSNQFDFHDSDLNLVQSLRHQRLLGVFH